jgi:hypothetical protein
MQGVLGPDIPKAGAVPEGTNIIAPGGFYPAQDPLSRTDWFRGTQTPVQRFSSPIGEYRDENSIRCGRACP